MRIHHHVSIILFVAIGGAIGLAVTVGVMLGGVERAARAAGMSSEQFLQVKTVGPSRPDENYARTREFYLACGFRPLEEFKTLWGERIPCLQLVKRIAP